MASLERDPDNRRRQNRGVRFVASALLAATVLSQAAESEALPAQPRALLQDGFFHGNRGHALLGCRRLGGPATDRGTGALCRQAASTLRGGGFGWGGAPEEQRQPPSHRGASGLFGAAWGGGSPDNISNNNNNNDHDNNALENRSQRVDTRGPPDLGSRPPPTVPGRSDGGGTNPSAPGFLGGIGSGGGRGGGDSAGDRVRTVGPPDAGGAGDDRRGVRKGFFASPTAPPSHQQQQQQQQQQQAGRRYGIGGRVDPAWAGESPKVGWGGGRRVATGRDDGEGGPSIRGWRRGDYGYDLSDGRGLMAVHYLVISCFLLFSVNTLFGVDYAFHLSLNHHRPRWWQSVTSLLLHGNQHHLMSNMFNLMIFGKMAEEDMGSVGMLLSFMACGVASSFVSLMIMPPTISSCGSSGAIFGLYSVCVLGKMFNLGRRGSSDGRLRKLVEAAVFGWFVVESVMSEMRMVVAGGVTGIDHAAHFGGVFAGAVLILMLRRSFREKSSRERNIRERGA